MASDTRYSFLDLRLADSYIADELKAAAARVIDSGRYIGGSEVAAFEQELCDLVGADSVVGVGNGLDALRLSMRALIIDGHLNEADEVIVPANTYIASVLAIIDAGLKPILVDPDDTTMCLSGEALERAITSTTRAVMPVHLYGRVAWDEKMLETARRHNLIVIEDCAQSIGARATADGLFESRHAGALGHVGAFSFYPTKNIGAVGDAGAVATNIPHLNDTVRALANYGSDYRYHNIHLGFNSRLDPIQAAMIRVKLKHLNRLNAERFALATAYHNTIRSPYVITPLRSQSVTDCVWHQYVVRSTHRDELHQFLAINGVETDIHYPAAVHQQPCMSHISHQPLPLSEQLGQTVLSLPITPGCTSVKEASDIGRIINKFIPESNHE